MPLLKFVAALIKVFSIFPQEGGRAAKVFREPLLSPGKTAVRLVAHGFAFGRLTLPIGKTSYPSIFLLTFLKKSLLLFLVLAQASCLFTHMNVYFEPCLKRIFKGETSE